MSKKLRSAVVLASDAKSSWRLNSLCRALNRFNWGKEACHFTLRGRCYSWAAGYLYECIVNYWMWKHKILTVQFINFHSIRFYKPLTCLWPLTSLSHLHNISIPSPTCQPSQHRFTLATLTASSLPSRMVSSKVSIAGSSVSSCSWLAPSSYSWSCHGFQAAPAIPDHPQSIPKHPKPRCIFWHFHMIVLSHIGCHPISPKKRVLQRSCFQISHSTSSPESPEDVFSTSAARGVPSAPPSLPHWRNLDPLRGSGSSPQTATR